MAYTFQGITNKVLKSLNEIQLTTESDFNTATGFHEFVKDAVNWSIAEICNRQDFEWPFLKAVGTQVLSTDGTTDYTLPATTATVDWDSFYIARDDNLTYGAAKKLSLISESIYRDRIRINDLNMDSTGYGKPDFVVRNLNNQFSISIPPSEAYTVMWNYFSRPTELVNTTDVPDIPQQYEYVIVDGAMYRAYMFRDNVEQAGLTLKAFEEGIVRMRRALIPISEITLFET